MKRATVMKSSLISGLILLLGVAGCAVVPLHMGDEINAGPFYTPRNYAAVELMPFQVQRVVLLPVAMGHLTAAEAVTASIDEAVLTSLIRTERFEVTTLSRQECRAVFGRAEFTPGEILPHGFLAEVQQRTGAGAVMLVQLTSLKLYQPQHLGFRATLASCVDGAAIWSIDEVLSGADTAVRNSARRDYYQQEHGNRPYDFSLAGLQSPSWFAAFVARQMFSTLPPR
jgi:hypothetical protein